MKPKLIPQLAIITAEDPEQLQDKINAELLAHPHYIDLQIDDSRAILQYNIEIQPPKAINLLTGPDQDAHIDYSLILTPENATDIQRVILELVLPDHGPDRYCCECENYRWGNGCPYRDGHIRLMDSACTMFNLHVGYDQPDVQSKTKKIPQIDWSQAAGSPRYIFEWIGGNPPDPKYAPLEGNDLTAEEISLALYGKPRSIPESKLIILAAKTGAAVLWKTMPFEREAVQLYPEE